MKQRLVLSIPECFTSGTVCKERGNGVNGKSVVAVRAALNVALCTLVRAVRRNVLVLFGV